MRNKLEIQILSLWVLCHSIVKEVQLIVPEYSRISERLQLDTTNQLETNENVTFEMTPMPDPEVYMNGVKQGIKKYRTVI